MEGAVLAYCAPFAFEQDLATEQKRVRSPTASSARQSIPLATQLFPRGILKTKSKSTCTKTSRPKIKNLSAIRQLPSGVLRGTVCFRSRGTRRKRKGAVLEYCPLSFSSMTLLQNKTIPKFHAPLCKITKRKFEPPKLLPTGILKNKT